MTLPPLKSCKVVQSRVEIVPVPSPVGTFLNIRQQFEIDVNKTRAALISKNIVLFVFQFLEKMWFNTMFQTVKSI